jgi:hypothetical protein
VLLKALRAAGYTVPLVMYSTAKYAARNHEEVRQNGGLGATASFVQLLAWLEHAIQKAQITEAP